MTRPWLLASLLGLVLSGCAGEGTSLPADLGEPGIFPDSGVAPDQTGPLADATLGPDGAAPVDGGAPTADAGACKAVVPAGTYKGTLQGMLTGTITFQLAVVPGGLALVEAGSKVVVDKNQTKTTYPIVMGTLACTKLHAALARPPGSTGGTDLRGAIDGTFSPPDTFKGSWNLPGSTTGTFKAVKQ